MEDTRGEGCIGKQKGETGTQTWLGQIMSPDCPHMKRVLAIPRLLAPWLYLPHCPNGRQDYSCWYWWSNFCPYRDMAGNYHSSISQSSMGVEWNSLLDKWFDTFDWIDGYFNITVDPRQVGPFIFYNKLELRQSMGSSNKLIWIWNCTVMAYTSRQDTWNWVLIWAKSVPAKEAWTKMIWLTGHPSFHMATGHSNSSAFNTSEISSKIIYCVTNSALLSTRSHALFKRCFFSLH